MSATKTATAVKLAVDKEVKRLQTIIDRQAEVIENMRKKQFRIPTGKVTGKGSVFNRVIVPDSHGAHIDTKAAKAFLSDLEVLKPKEVVMLGDHTDCGGFLAQHHTLGFVPETEYTYQDDVGATNDFLDKIQARVGPIGPHNFDQIEGNHEHRIAKWIIKQTLANGKDAAYLMSLFGIPSVLGLEKRGIRYVERGKQYDGLQKRGTIKRGKCLFAHGTRCGIYAAKQTLQDYGSNICTGHTHRVSAFLQETINGIIGSWQFGCLCQLHPLYGDTNFSNWAHAYGLQVVNRDGSFMTITVPIIDGVSYLRGLIH